VHSNRYTLLYAAGVTGAVATLLAVAVTGLRPLQEENARQAKRRTILETVMDVSPETLREDYEAFIRERVFDADGREASGADAFSIDLGAEAKKAPDARLYPLYVYRREGRTRYIVPVRGAGLWGPIEAYLAIDADRNTIRGAVFSHEKETPGLGAEIAESFFGKRFEGKKLFSAEGGFRAVTVRRGGAGGGNDDPHAVDGLTGATMTINGVNRMLRQGLAVYAQIFARMGDEEGR
jgi:Na+-transporting NADH:ubiquinone oxidoreductase subunit C